MIYVPTVVMRICMLQDRAPFKEQSVIQFWLHHESSYNRLSQLALFSWRLLPGTMFDDIDWPLNALCSLSAIAKFLVSLCGDLKARKRNRTRVCLYRQVPVFLKLNRHILHWTKFTVYCELKYNLFSGIVQQQKVCCRDYIFRFLLTYLVLSLVIPH